MTVKSMEKAENTYICIRSLHPKHAWSLECTSYWGIADFCNNIWVFFKRPGLQVLSHRPPLSHYLRLHRYSVGCTYLACPYISIQLGIGCQPQHVLSQITRVFLPFLLLWPLLNKILMLTNPNPIFLSRTLWIIVWAHQVCCHYCLRTCIAVPL